MIKDNNNWDYRSCFTCQQSYYEMGVGLVECWHWLLESRKEETLQ